MRFKLIAASLAVALLLSGCSWMDGSYYSVKPHTQQSVQQDSDRVEVSDYQQIQQALSNMVQDGLESGLLSVGSFKEEITPRGISQAIDRVMTSDPICVYAVTDISFELGVNGDTQAVAVTILYNQNYPEIRKIRHVQDPQSAIQYIHKSLQLLETTLVLRIEGFETMDYSQVVENYARENPAQVMEVPQLVVSEYPETGTDRVVAIQFNYQTNREALRSMLSYVQPVFSSATLYVSGEGEQGVKYAQLYSFLMERNAYTVQTSITPAYSLLRHGVGDSKAFATVYAAMCRDAGLEAEVISGTKAGEPWFWNMICEDGVYYHVDLLRAHTAGTYQTYTDAQMRGYVWDYTAYPVCGVLYEKSDGTVS